MKWEGGLFPSFFIHDGDAQVTTESYTSTSGRHEYSAVQINTTTVFPKQMNVLWVTVGMNFAVSASIDKRAAKLDLLDDGKLALLMTDETTGGYRGRKCLFSKS